MPFQTGPPIAAPPFQERILYLFHRTCAACLLYNFCQTGKPLDSIVGWWGWGWGLGWVGCTPCSILASFESPFNSPRILCLMQLGCLGIISPRNFCRELEKRIVLHVGFVNGMGRLHAVFLSS